MLKCANIASHMALLEQLREYQESNADNLAREVSQEILSQGYVFVSKTGMTPDDALNRTFQKMEDLSLIDSFSMRDGRPVRFVTITFGSEELLANIRGTSTTIQDRIIAVASGVSKFTEREREIRDRREFWNPPKSVTGVDGVREIITSTMSEKYTGFAIKLRNALKLLGNPPRYPLDDTSSKYYEEIDPAYPSLIPLLNIHMDHRPINGITFYADFNRRFAPHESDIFHGKMKRSDIFSPEELQTADESAAVVGLVDHPFYQGWGLPRTKFGIATPLFMYDAISERYGYAYEGWLGFGPNDELMETIRNLRIETL